MNNRMAYIVVSALIGLCAYGLSTRAAVHTPEQQIRALEQRFAAAVQAKDLNRIMTVYAPGSRLFVFDVTPPRQHVGWDDYRRDWKGFLGQVKGPVRFELSDLSITTDGRLGFSHSIQHIVGQTADGTTMDVTARVTDDYEKIGGRWYIVTEHVSVPVDLATERGDLQSKP
jgi:ketosteroid isomerase-like protein